MVEYRHKRVVDNVARPKRGDTEACHTEYQAADSHALVPCSVGKSLVMRIGHLTIKNLAHYTKNVHSRNDYTRAGNYRSGAVEYVVVHERTYEYRHLGNEARETWQTKVGKTGNDIADTKERHNLHQAAKLAYVTGMCTAVNHTDKCEEQGRHQSV